jgi:hypothetical protein
MRKFAGAGPKFSPETPAEKRAFAALRKRNFVANGLTKQGWKALRQFDDEAWSD